MKNFAEIESQYEFDVYAKRGITLVRGESAKIWDDQGKEYIDCVSGHGVANIGHANPKVIEAITKQAATLITCSNVFYNDQRALLLEKLISVTPKSLTRAFLCSTGTEAVEGAIKFARFATKKTDFVCAMKSFHGRTMGALSATFNPKYKEDFQPVVPGFTHVPYNNFEKLAEAITENTAAVMLEVVQGEGGVNMGEKEFFQKARQLCDEKGILLIIDEIQTGFCRTGKWFAIEHFGIEPDMMCVAKAIAGGIPMGAILCSDKIPVPTGRHGTTFGGNPLACAAGIAALDYMIENNLAEETAKKGEYFAQKMEAFKDLAAVRECRNRGLMIGIELKTKVKPFLEKLMDEGVLALPAGTTVLRLLPPLTISYEELDFVAEKVGKVLAE